ncbi:FUSC family protein, partial [Dactylosporangium salmoneum]|uniref:FUSC family protein n=1 Tax=Dactylosporangium salmoneum TaxID=53361 RepID=UPI0031E18071
VAVALAGGIATAAGFERPYWAMTAALVPLSVVTLRRQVTRGVHRAAGTVAGLGVAAGLLVAPLPIEATIALVALCQAGAELLVGRHYAAAMVFITPLALLVGQIAAPQPVPGLLVARLVETVIGVGVGVATAVATRE